MSSPALKLANTHFNTPKEGTIDATLLLLVEENKRLRDERESMMNSKVTMDEHAWAIVKNYRETIVKMDEDLKNLKDTLKKQNEEHLNADEQILKLNKELVALKDAENEKLKKEVEELKKEVKEQREEIWYSTLLTAEVIQNNCPEELKHLCTDEKAQEICDKYKAGVATYLCDCDDIDYEKELNVE